MEMMAKPLTIALAADIDNLEKGLKDAQKVVDNSADRIADFGKKAALAFAAVGAAATAFAVSAVKAAAEDEKARKNLEQTIRSNTKATCRSLKEHNQCHRCTDQVNRGLYHQATVGLWRSGY